MIKKRPLSITVIGLLFIAAGIVGLAYHGSEIKLQLPIDYQIVWACAVRLLAIVGGIFLLKGKNWGRWLLLAWIAYHVVLSAFHSLSEVIMHGLLLVLFTYFLCRRQASAYFRTG